MPVSLNQQTIENAAEVHGRGYWSGQEVTVRFLPAEPGSGIRFVRTDLPSRPGIPALVGRRESMSLRTVLKSECGTCVSMVEHLLSALFAYGVDNCLIEVDADEMPGLDGSAIEFADAIKSAGQKSQDAVVHPIVIDQVIRIGTADGWIEASPNSEGKLEVEYQLDYGEDCPIPPQSACCAVTPESFHSDLANARTFVTADQAKQLRAMGVASHVTHKDLLIFDDSGPVDNELHFENECARHKALDMVGDLALVGTRLIGRFVSHRGGHELNAKMARKLLGKYQYNSFGCQMTA